MSVLVVVVGMVTLLPRKTVDVLVEVNVVKVPENTTLVAVVVVVVLVRDVSTSVNVRLVRLTMKLVVL